MMRRSRRLGRRRGRGRIYLELLGWSFGVDFLYVGGGDMVAENERILVFLQVVSNTRFVEQDGLSLLPCSGHLALALVIDQRDNNQKELGNRRRWRYTVFRSQIPKPRAIVTFKYITLANSSRVLPHTSSCWKE